MPTTPRAEDSKNELTQVDAVIELIRVYEGDELKALLQKWIEDSSAARWAPISLLKPWANNPRDNDGRAVEAVAESISRFGFASPLLARLANGEIIAGHTRLKAAKLLGLKKVPVRYLDITEEEAHLLALADNKIGELADWKNDILAGILAELDADDLAVAGFDDDDLANILGDDEPLGPDDIETEDIDDAADEEIPEHVEPTTKAGDVVEMGPHVLHCGDCIEVMQGMAENSVDAIVTDPPYGLGFMGKAWDALPPGEDWARECLRVLKPGGHIVAFGGQRTIHRLTVSLEDAGFSIRELFGWLQWQGFPKSLDASKALDAHHGAEREVLGTRKRPGGPTKMTEARGWNPGPMASDDATVQLTAPATEDARTWEGFGSGLKPCLEPAVIARKPLIGTVAENLLEWGTGALNIDGCRYDYGDEAWPGPCEGYDAAKKRNPHTYSSFGRIGPAGGSGATITASPTGRWPANIYATPKASRSERGEGNLHPTVKPVKLMRWLCVLVGCQPGSLILEPFAGSGTTLVAAHREGFECVAIEREPAYCDIVRARVEAALRRSE